VIVRARLRRIAAHPGAVSALMLGTLAVGTIVVAGPSLLADSIILGFIWALVAAGLTLVFGVMNVPNFAQGALFMIGSSVAYVMHAAFSDAIVFAGSLGIVLPIAVVLAAAAASGLVGLAAERILFVPLRRRAGEDWVTSTFISTAALSVFLINLHQVAFGSGSKGIVGYYPQYAPLHSFGLVLSPDRIFALIVGLSTLLGLGALLRHSRFGRAMRAVAQDETGARLLGISVSHVHMLTFTLSSALAGLAGGTLLFLFPSSPYVGQQPLFLAWMVVILAGLGKVLGTLVASLVIALLNNDTTYVLGVSWTSVVPFVLMIALLLVKPSGLTGHGANGTKGKWER
jgi:branched-chain amino acid transport system permease protein